MMQSTDVAFAAWTVIAQDQPAKGNAVVMPGMENEAAAKGAVQQQATGTGTPPPVAPAGGVPQSPFGGSSMLLIFAVFLGFMILTQVMSARKEKKRRETLMTGLSKGDRVVTMSGIMGEVAEIGEDSVVIRLEDGRMRVSKAAVQSIVPSREHAKGGTGELEVKTTSREKTTA